MKYVRFIVAVLFVFAFGMATAAPASAEYDESFPPPTQSEEYTQDPFEQGNAPVGGGPNVVSGPGEYIAPQYLDMVPLEYHEYIVAEKDRQLAIQRTLTIVSVGLVFVAIGLSLPGRSASESSPVGTTPKKQRPLASKVSPANNKQ